MTTQTIHMIIVSGTAYMIAGTAMALFGLYMLAKTGFFRDFFTGKK